MEFAFEIRMCDATEGDAAAIAEHAVETQYYAAETEEAQ